MPKLRVHRLELSTPTLPPKLRLHRLELSGSAPAKLRVHRLAFTGDVAVVVQPFVPRTVEPGQSVTLTAVLASLLTADSYVWTQLAGPPVTLTGLGASTAFVAPSDAAGTTVQFGVVAIIDGVSSAEVIAAVDILPEIEWRATADGWKPARSYLL